MVELPLVRSGEDRRRYELEGFGSMRWQGWIAESVELLTRDGRALRAGRSGVTRTAAEATEPTGSVVGAYRRKGIFSYAGTVTWGDQTHEIRSESVWSSRFVLERDGSTELRVRVRAWGQPRAYVVVEAPGLDPGLVLFVTYLVQSIVAESSSGTG